MTTYFAPYIDESGLHYPTFDQYSTYLKDNARRIFGNDIYLDADSMDGEDISIRSKIYYDTMKAVEFAYNNHSPQKAIGTALASIIKLNGIKFKGSGYSTVLLKLTGLAYANVKNGVVSDVASNKWDLPALVNLGENGIAYVTATAQNIGSITAQIGDITKIETPTYGWTGVTNESIANVGQSVETESQVRLRQSQSVSLPSQGLVEGTQASLYQLSGVTDAIVKENDTTSPITVDGVSLPANSITCIVKGGSDQDIADTIFYKKNQGCKTNGSTEVVVYDGYQNINRINFSRPTNVPIKMALTINPIAGKGYSTDITAQIKDKLVEYITDLNVSNDVFLSALYTIINSVMPDMSDPIFSIGALTIAKVSGTLGSSNIALNLNEEATLDITNVVITVS